MPLTPLDSARQAAFDAIAPAAPERVPLLDAQGRFLAAPVTASRSLPGCDNSAMDGWAVRAEETQGASRDRPARLRVTSTLFAGALPSTPLRPGEAARVFTGAPLPPGADAVVRQEATRAAEDGACVDVFITVPPGNDIRRTGEEVLTGTPLFDAGQRVGAAVLGVLASMGATDVWVRPMPRVAVLATGDELVPPGTPALPHQVYESNLVLVAALAREAGADVRQLARARDDERALRDALTRLAPQVDVLITTGGASVGDKDLVKRVLAALGARFFVDGVALKPGKPVAVARLGDTSVVVLPGNPGAATVAFDQFARPLLLKHQGVLETRRRVRAHLSEARHKQAGLTYLITTTLEARDGLAPRAVLRPQGAGQILQNVHGEGWALLPPGRADFAEDDPVDVELFDRPTFTPLGALA
ncbi:gephyrin-like molybdotransferase Glp [Myxococcus xanthus]|uniref:molybdopterin molybdotransferase MoeA n=1 Tax=Myxococcus xanthus TaxID=34 RepID=UPI001127CFDD|nr:gephyrin-like molybdotransferase Glp [Myxococcus xanthus]QDE86796.1 molybdopterin molybdenumtransferase MoeA [Myxococcus xanthus]QDF00956.1 molybdopterin molybdenumtransferase MoeA [Myxococcus xanthus]QDF08802.1 molybdopterin molybdenumtransferase MoeA [Myxococcus xanthus]